jgi:hypothetical protein
MAYILKGWDTYREDPVAAAARAHQTAQRRVVDTAHDYHSALARGDTATAEALRSKFREAWETDVRRRGGKPEDMIPGYPDYEPTPVAVPSWGFFGDSEKQTPVIKLIVVATVFYFLWTYFK